MKESDDVSRFPTIVVIDNTDTTKLLQRMLINEGFKVVEGVEFSKEINPTIIDLDMQKAEEAVASVERMRVALVGASTATSAAAISARELRAALANLEIAMTERIGETLQNAINDNPMLKMFIPIRAMPDWATDIDNMWVKPKGHKRNGKQKRNPDRWR